MQEISLCSREGHNRRHFSVVRRDRRAGFSKLGKLLGIKNGQNIDRFAFSNIETTRSEVLRVGKQHTYHARPEIVMTTA